MIIKLFAIIMMLIALFLLYRIAYPKRTDTTKGNDIPEKETKSLPDIMGKSRFVLPERSKPLQTPATFRETEKGEEKSDIFASETKNGRSMAIPPEEMDEAFSDNSNPEIMSLSLDDEDESEIDFEVEEAEEAEELHRALGHEPVTAEGIDYNDLRTVVKVVKEQPEEVSKETGRALAALENTDMFEKLASGNERMGMWIKTIIDRYLQKQYPEIETQVRDESDDNEWKDFDMQNYLS